MADITYTIGAKDNATQTLNKVDSALDRVQKSTKDLGDASERSLGKVSLSLGSLAKAAGLLGAASLAMDGLRSLYGAVAGGIDDFDAAEESVRQLDQAMELNGGSSEALVEKYTALADAIERNTNIAAEDAQALMKQAAVLGVSNDKLDEMTTAAVGVSEALGVSLEDGLKKVMLATEGNFKSFEKLIPSIKNMATDEEKLAAVMELSARGMAMSEAASQSAGGQYERMQHRIGNLMETIGAVLAPIRELAYKGIILLADALANMLGPAIQGSQDLFKAWEPVILGAIESTVNGIIAGLTMAEVIYNNFGDVVGMAIDYVLLKYETYRADTEHLFVTTIPAYISWFANNFFNIIETAFNAVVTVISNHIQKIADTFTVLWDFIASGGSTDVLGQLGEIAGRSYLDGFENTIGELPNIAARAMTAREQELSASIGSVSAKLAEEFSTKFEARAVKLGSTVSDSLVENIDLSLSDVAMADDDKKKKKKKAIATGDAIQAQESRLITRGTSSDPIQLLQKIADGIANLGNNASKQTEAQLVAASAAAQLANQLQGAPKISIQGVP